MTADQLSFWTLVTSGVSAGATVLSAVIALAAAVVAYKAAGTWRAGLAEQSAAACVEGVHLCAGAVGRVVALKQEPGVVPAMWSAYDSAWDEWTKVRAAFAVCRRYRGDLDEHAIRQGRSTMGRLRAFCRSERATGDAAEAEAINQEFGKLTDKFESLLAPGWQRGH